MESRVKKKDWAPRDRFSFQPGKEGGRMLKLIRGRKEGENCHPERKGRYHWEGGGRISL